jgi:hypothetical protein
MGKRKAQDGEEPARVFMPKHENVEPNPYELERERM